MHPEFHGKSVAHRTAGTTREISLIAWKWALSEDVLLMGLQEAREGEVLPCSRNVRGRVVSRGRGDHRHATRRREASRVLHLQGGEYISEYCRVLPVFDVLTAMHKSREVHHPLRVLGR